jgi:hypothetical protein
MKVGKLVIGVSIAASCALAQSWITYGNHTYGSDGSSYSTYGNHTYGSDGSSYSNYGNTWYGN